jgi:hypothetical protein
MMVGMEYSLGTFFGLLLVAGLVFWVSQRRYWLQRALVESPEARKRRRFGTAVKTLLAAVTVSCVFGGWVVFCRMWISQRREFVKYVTQHTSHDVQPAYKSDGPSAPLGLGLFGERGVRAIFFYENEPNYKKDRARAATLFPEAHIGHRE